VRALAAIAAGLLVAGCATAPGGGGGGAVAPGGAVPAATAATAPRPPEPSEGRRGLDRGIALFEQGKFAEAVRLLQESPEIAADGVEVRAQSLKYQAFGQCVTGRQAACRRSFDALLALDPSFALTPAEAGHPSWGREFERAKAAAGAGAVGRRASR
jgi:hypothetical protein